MDNELETLHTDIECLEVCADLILSRSHNKARTAIIVLHHLAETLLQRECEEYLERDRLYHWVMKPTFTRSERTRIERSFADKVFLVRDRTAHLSQVDEAILLIGHSYRNAIYHRNTHNAQTASLLAKLLLKTALRLFMRSGQEMSMGARNSEQLDWVEKYNLSPKGFIEFGELRKSAVRMIAPLAKVSFQETNETLTSDIISRTQRLTDNLESFFGDKWRSDLGDLLKRVEFEIENEKEYDELSKDFREVTYKINTKHPPTHAEYNTAQSLYKDRLKLALNSFRPVYTTDKILSLNTLADSVSCKQDLRSLVLAYQKADEVTQKAELYIARAHTIVETQIDIAIDKALGK